MGLKEPKKKLGKFLGDQKGTFTKKKLIKYGLAMGTAIIGASFMLEGTALAHANSHSNIDHTGVNFEPIPTVPTCSRLVPVHSQHDSHCSHGNHSNHSSY